jgi:hypothetical protein
MYTYNVRMCVKIMIKIGKNLHNIGAPDDMEKYSGMCGR